MTFITSTILPIVMSLCMFFTGSSVLQADKGYAYQGEYTVTINGETTLGTASADADGMRLDLSQVPGVENGALSIALSKGNLTLTVNGQESVIPLSAGLISGNSLAQSMGLSQEQADYFTGAGFMSDLAIVGQIINKLDPSELITMTDDADGLGGTIMIKSDQIKQAISQALMLLMSDAKAIDELSALKAWDVFAPEVTDRRTQTILLLRDMAGTIRDIQGEGDILMKVRIDGEKTNMQTTISVSHGDTITAADLTLDMTQATIDVNLTVSKMQGENRSNPLSMSLNMTRDQHGITGAVINVTALHGGASHHAQLTCTSAGNALSIVGEYQKYESPAQDARIMRRASAELTIPKDEAINPTLRATFEGGIDENGVPANITNMTAKLTNGQLSLLIDCVKPESKILSATLSWQNANKLEGSAVLTQGSDVTIATLDAGASYTDTQYSVNTKIKADRNGEALLDATIDTTLSIDAANTNNFSQTFDCVVKGKDANPTTINATAKHHLIVPEQTAVIEAPQEAPDATIDPWDLFGVGPAATPEENLDPTPVPTNVEPDATVGLNDIAQSLLTTPQPTVTSEQQSSYEATGVANGYLGRVYATVVCDAAGTIQRVSFRTEFEGKGAVLDTDEAFASQFIGQSGKVDMSSVDTISEATWTCQGAVEAVNNALEQIVAEMAK